MPPPAPPSMQHSVSLSPHQSAVDFAHRSPTQHARIADERDMSLASKLRLAPAALSAADEMADTPPEDHTHNKHSAKEHKHAELFINTNRAHSLIPAAAADSGAVVPPAGLHAHSPSSSAEPSSTHSHSSSHSSTDCSPAMAYRGLQISVAGHGAHSASGSGLSERQATTSQCGSLSSANVTDSSDGSINGGTIHPASGNQDSMQLATPHPVPASTQGATQAESVASAPPASTKASADCDMPTPSNNGTTPAAAIKAEPSSAMESECSSAASTPASGAVHASATPAEGTPASSSSASSSSSSAPERKSGGRYKPVRTLQNSLFGQVQLAFDSLRGCEVAVKVSHAELVQPKNQGDKAASAADAAATARSQAGVAVLEDVRREARILRLLLGSQQPAFSTNDIDSATCGLSNALLHAIHLPANAVVQPGATNPLTIKQQFLDSISKGKKSIAAFYDEVEAESFHYLISEYISGGDLFSVLTAQPAHKVSEGVARQWMYQLCCSVRYLHANSVAHLDLSLENICMDSHGHIRLIDFGLAAQHPGYAGAKRTVLSDGSTQRNASNHIRLLSESAATASCDCAACKVSSERLRETDPALLTALKAGHTLAKLKYLCRPVCEKVHKPGKLGYMSPELYQNQSWDAYAHDIFGLGVILYSMLTGRPPFTRPDESSDVWFRVLHSGQWLMPQVRQQPPASIYSSLSPNALHLIDMLIKPQHMRPSIDVVLKHPWLNPAHPGNAGAVPSSKLALGSRGAGLQLGKDGRKMVQRRGSD